MSGSTAAARGRSVAATGFDTAQPRLTAKPNTPCAKFKWFVTVFTASPEARAAAMYAAMSCDRILVIALSPSPDAKCRRSMIR
jgi:hypothetical protein